jgi:uncharacterized protein (DUF111 family)
LGIEAQRQVLAQFAHTEGFTVARELVEVETRWGKVRIKLGRRSGQELNAQPEYEDCRALAEKHGVPLKSVWMEAIAAHLRR